MIPFSITIPLVVSVRLVTYTVLIRCVREKNASAFYACEVRRVCHRDVLSFCIGKNGIVLQGDSFFEADEKADRNSKK